MGCGPSTGREFDPVEWDRRWNQVSNTRNKPVVTAEKHRNWKILRILLVSTFKDFRNERQAVLALVEEELQKEASEERIFIQIEDFNSESKATFDSPTSVYVLDNCIREARKTTWIYIHFLGDCAGYIIDDTFKDDNFLETNHLIRGLSLGEIAAGLAALFLHRDPSFLKELPFNERSFIDDDVNRARAVHFAETVKENSNQSIYMDYKVQTVGFNNPHHRHIVFSDLSEPIRRLRSHILSVVDSIPMSLQDPLSANEMIVKNYENRQCNNDVLQKTLSMIKVANVAVSGDFGSGKTSILMELRKRLSGSIYLQATSATGVEEIRSSAGTGQIVLLDDADEVGKAISNIVQTLSHLKFVLATRRNNFSTLPELQVFRIPEMSKKEAVAIMTTFSGTTDSRKADEIYTQSKISDGKEKEWTVMKCRVVGAMMASGKSLEKIAALSKHSTSSVVEADLYMFEMESRGHLPISILCFLAVIKSGLTETELRALLANEYKCIPIGIRRKNMNLPFDYYNDTYGSIPQLPPLRWWIAIAKVEHLLDVVDEHSNHYVLQTVVRKCIFKKFLTTPETIGHFKKRVERLMEKDFVWMRHRKKDLREFLQ